MELTFFPGNFEISVFGLSAYVLLYYCHVAQLNRQFSCFVTNFQRTITCFDLLLELEIIISLSVVYFPWFSFGFFLPKSFTRPEWSRFLF